ncbi:hypothetical protein P9112_001595 [Eukaryota sp. TZLM1-RC]
MSSPYEEASSSVTHSTPSQTSLSFLHLTPHSMSSGKFHFNPHQTSSNVLHSTQGTTSSGVTQLTPDQFKSGQQPTITRTNGDPHLPPPNTSSGQNPNPGLTLSEVIPSNENAHSTATKALTTANFSHDEPPVTSPELKALLATLAEAKSEKQKPTDFVESFPLDTSLYPNLENCVSVQTLNETIDGFREVPLTPQELQNSKERLDQESKHLSGRPAERRIRLSPFD